MYKQIKVNAVAVMTALALMLLLSLSSSTVLLAQEKGKGVQPTGTPVLWRDPGDIASRDLLLGPGGEEMKPDINNLPFLEADTTG